MGTAPEFRVHEFESINALEAAASRLILDNAERAILARGAFRIVLAGGQTPRNLYHALRSADADWLSWHVYFGDERCLPADDPECNSAMARSAWLDHVQIPANQIHAIQGELGPEAAAASYTRELAQVGEFDLVLLGLGVDGHTASLFPGRDWGEAEDAAPVIAVHDAPKMPPGRVSLSAHRLSRTRDVLFVVTGPAKREALKRLLSGDRIPAAAIRAGSSVDIYTDLHLQAGTVLHSGQYA